MGARADMRQVREREISMNKKSDIIVRVKRKDAKRWLREIDRDGTMMPMFDAGATVLAVCRKALEEETSE